MRNTMRIERILLDLDDTLNQLTMWSMFVAGCDVDPMNNSQFPVEVGYDVVAATNLMHPGVLSGERDPWTVPEFWDNMKREHWATAPKSEQCDWLIESAVRMVGEDEVYIATSPTKDPDCLAGKLEWIHENLPPFMHRQYSITPRKHIAASPYTLLIDDCLDNVVDFQNGKFPGLRGQTLLIPKPWNPRNGEDTWTALINFFKRFPR
jgi:hypothetical protein